jgi:2-desacetyl-2-hydroxyethyl bacteriochlorophyllide A dehydrogenase
MSQKMWAARLHGPNDLRMDEIAIPAPRADEVLIEVHRCGICGTDLHIAKGNFPAPNLPLTLGHEFSGTIVELGSSVSTLAVGDRVVVDINIACGSCVFCRKGAKLFCPTVRQLGVHDSGGLAEYVVAPASNIYVLPSTVSLDTAAYVEPLACAVHGQDRVGIQSGDIVLVIGGGPMGLAHTILSKGSGASCVIVSEPDEKRRNLAKALGADVVIDPLNEELDLAVKEVSGGIGPDVVIEAVGSIRTYESSVAVVRRGGKVLAYGAAPQDAYMQLRPFDVYAKELTIVGSYAGTYGTWPRAISLLDGGRFDPSLIVDSVRPLAETIDAIKGLERDRSIVKIHIQMNGNE